MKYKIIKSDLLLNGQIIPENSEVDLSESETKGIENYLEKCLPAVTPVVAGHSDPNLSGEESNINSETNEQKNKTKRGTK